MCALINSEGLLWSASTCVPVHFLKVCCEKTSLLRCSPHVGRLHLLFITSWLYFSSKFLAGVQSAQKPSLCARICAVIPLCKNADWAQIKFLPRQTRFPNIWEYTCPLILTVERVVCSQIHRAHMKRLHSGQEGRATGKFKHSDCITIQIKHAE